VPSSAAMRVLVVLTRVHPVSDGFAGLNREGARKPWSGSGAGDEDPAKDGESVSVSVGVAQLPICVVASLVRLGFVAVHWG
jgi:hypothetical protein